MAPPSRWSDRLFANIAKRGGRPFPVAVALGADPATILGAVTPVPDTLPSINLRGLLRGSRTEVASCLGSICRCGLERDRARRRDSTGGDGGRGSVWRSHRLYNEKGNLSVFTVERVTTQA